MKLNSLSKSTKLFLLTFVAYIALFYILPKDECGNICGKDSFIPGLAFLLLIFLPAVLIIVERIKRRHSLWDLVGTLIILVILLLLCFFLFIASSRAYCRSYSSRTISEISQLRVAQEMFYSKNGRYADTQEELIKVGIIDSKLKDWVKDKELSDKDGKGIESGDNDPETWSVTVFVSDKEINKWCKVISKGFWYVCNQDGCHKEQGLI